MKCLITLALLFFVSIGHTQSFDEVDSTQVFYELEFGTNPENIKGRLQLDLTISYGTSYYKYSGKLLKYIEEFKTDDINLGFHEDKLIYIDAYFSNMKLQEFEELKTRLEKAYGASAEFTAIDRGVINSVEWKGNNLTMQLYRYGDQASDAADRNKTVLAITKN